MHGYVVVDEGDVAGLPGDVERELFAEFGGDIDGFAVEGFAVAKSDGFGGVVAGVFPALGGGDELVEEGLAAVLEGADGGEDGSGGFKGAIGEPFPRVVERLEAALGVFA